MAHAIEHRYVSKQKKDERSSSHPCHFVSEGYAFVACQTPFLHLQVMAAAIWQLINENDGACVIAVLNAVLHCLAIFLLLLHKLIIHTSLAILVVLQLMQWAHDNLGACCGRPVCDECGCAP